MIKNTFIILFLVLSFKVAADGGDYQCTATTGVTTMPIDLNIGQVGVWVPGLGGSGAIVVCSHFVMEDLPDDMTDTLVSSSVWCDMIVLSNISGGFFEHGTAHDGDELFLQIGVAEDIFTTECYWIYNF